tara:strand:- start:217 stop:1101 length:885 start_codon:yes stop_codon:yes gene_type:complete
VASKRIYKRKTDVYPNKSFYEGRINLNKLGIPIGWYYKEEGKRSKWRILNAGLIQIGITNHVLGMCPNRKEIFLGRDGKLWRYKNVLLPTPVPDVLGCDREELNAWADACAREVIDRLTPGNEASVSERSQYRYRKIVQALVNQRILDSAAIGYECTALTFAQGISVEWTAHDLLFPRHATIRHATLVALVLALEADKAAQLIELAALIEMRIPFVSREAALSIYQQACSLLARLCPQWWNQGYTCRWELVGDIDRIFRAQYIRMIEDAWDNGTQFETVGGIAIRNLINSEPEE